MGNSPASSIKALAALGHSSRTRQRAPYEPHNKAGKSSAHVSPATPRASAINDPTLPHPNPYYVMHQTEQDALALPRAYGHDVSNIAPEAFQTNRPLGTENLDLDSLDIDSMQVKHSDVSDWVQGIAQGIEEKAAPGATASLEDQILALQYIGADPRQIAALQTKLDKKIADAQLHALNLPSSSTTASQSGVFITTSNNDSSSPRIAINPKILLQDILSPSPSSISSDNNLSKTYIKDQMPDISVDPHSDSIMAAHASRSLSSSQNPAEEPLFRHDPLQNLPTGRTAAAKSTSSNSDITRVIPGLCTSEQLDLYIQTRDVPSNFPITNKQHLEFLLQALKVAKRQPVETDPKRYKQNRFNSL